MLVHADKHQQLNATTTGIPKMNETTTDPTSALVAIVAPFTGAEVLLWLFKKVYIALCIGFFVKECFEVSS